MSAPVNWWIPTHRVIRSGKNDPPLGTLVEVLRLVVGSRVLAQTSEGQDHVLALSQVETMTESLQERTNLRVALPKKIPARGASPRFLSMVGMFELIASTIHDTHKIDGMTPRLRGKLAQHFADVLQETDTRFDRVKFLEDASGYREVRGRLMFVGKQTEFNFTEVEQRVVDSLTGEEG